MKKTKKLNALLLAIALMSSLLFYGCGGTSAESTGSNDAAASATPSGSTDSAGTGTSAGGTATTTDTETASAKIADGDVTLTIFCDFPDAARAYYTDLGDNPVVQQMEEETGLTLEFIHAPSGDDGSYFQMLLASGDLPDIMKTNLFETTYPGGVEGAIEDGILYNVTDLVNEYATNFQTLVNESGDPDVLRKITGDNGSIIKFGTTWLPETDNNKIFNGFIVRQDWLDAYGLEAPVTLDDYTNVLRVFKENGVQIPLALCQFNQAQFSANNPIASAFGVSVLDFDLDAEGNVNYCRTQDGYKEFLTVLSQWAEEGLIDTDFISRTISDSLKLFENGTAGMCFAHTYNVKEAVTAGAAIDPNFKITACEQPRINADDTTHMSKITSSINANSYQVSASSKYPEEAVKFIDYLMSPEILLLTAWGTNNEDCVTYTEDADGTRTFTDLVTNNPDGLDYNTVRSLYMCAPLQVKYDEQMEAAQYSLDECHQSWAAWGTNNDAAYRLPIYLTYTIDESKELADIKTKLSNYSDEKVYRFIFGEESLDTEWDSFVSELKDLGSERGEEICKAAYDRYLSR